MARGYKGFGQANIDAMSIITYVVEDTSHVKIVRRNKDVLHPSIPTAKAGYTFVGWALTPGGAKLTSLLATEITITLYALYVPNTLDILVGSFGGWSYDTAGWHISYSRTINSNYINGATDAYIQKEWSSGSATASFNLALNEYQNAEVIVQAKYCPNDTGNLSVGTARFDNNELNAWNLSGSTYTKTYSNVAAGNHSLNIYTISYDYYSQANVVGVTKITLSNPTPWT